MSDECVDVRLSIEGDMNAMEITEDTILVVTLPDDLTVSQELRERVGHKVGELTGCETLVCPAGVTLKTLEQAKEASNE